MASQADRTLENKSTHAKAILLQFENFLRDPKLKVSNVKYGAVMLAASKLTEQYVKCSADLANVVKKGHNDPLSVSRSSPVSELYDLSETLEVEFGYHILSCYEDVTIGLVSQLKNSEKKETVKAIQAEIEAREMIREAREETQHLKIFQLVGTFEMDFKRGLKLYRSEKARYKLVKSGAPDDETLANEFTKVARDQDESDNEGE